MPNHAQSVTVTLPLALLPATAAASTHGSMLELFTLELLASIGLAIAGGITYTAQKLANPDRNIVSMPLELISDFFTSVLIGMLGYFFSLYFGAPPVLQAGVITIGGYGGSRVLEPGLGRFIDFIATFGKPRA